jgi:enoyl-CoA hydratase/carnithine racemase
MPTRDERQKTIITMHTARFGRSPFYCCSRHFKFDAQTSCLSHGEPRTREYFERSAMRSGRGPRIALAAMKRNFNAAESGSLAQLLDLEARHQIETGRTQDHQEAARAFVEKRKPIFVGR